MNIYDYGAFYVRNYILFLFIPQHIGPCVLDSTAPNIDPNSAVDVTLVDDFLVANWPPNMIVDTEEPYSLHYTFSIGMYQLLLKVFYFAEIVSG